MKIKSKTTNLIIMWGAVLFLLTYHLSHWPTTWYDEGINLQVPKNLVMFGKYGIQSSEGVRLFDPLVSTGPTVLLPIALSFKLFGIGLVQARTVMVIFAMLALISVYVLTTHIFDVKTAFVALLLILPIPYFSDDVSASFLGLSRMALGEVPNLFFVIMGCLLYFKASDQNSLSLLLGAGVFFGLSIITKEQSLLIVPALILFWIIDRLWYHRIHLNQVLILLGSTLAIFVIWSLSRNYLTGTSYAEQNSGQIIVQAMAGFTSPSHVIHNIRVLLGSGTLIWGLPGLVYGVYLCAERSLNGFKRAFLFCLCIVWLAWFLIGSIGWLRYAFLGICLMQLFTAKLFVDLAIGSTLLLGAPNNSGGIYWITKERFQRLAIIALLTLLTITPLQQKTKEILLGSNNSPIEFAGYIRENIGPETVVESFEPEIVFLADNNFHQPSLSILMKTVRHVNFGEPYTLDMLELDKVRPEYLILGPFSKWTGIYANEIGSGKYTSVTTIGEYDLYKAIDQSE